MKKILIVLSLMAACIMGKAQTPGFPSIDSLSRYNNRYINNAAVEAFANRRLNTLLHGIIWWIDTAMDRADRLVIPGGGDTGQIRFNDTLFIFEITKDTIWQAILLKALNGLRKTGDSVMLGGPLIEETTIDQAGNGITFHDGPFRHYLGDVETFSAPYSDFTRTLGSTIFDGDDGTGESNYQLAMSSATPGGGFMQLNTYGADGAARITLQNDKVTLFPQNGNLFFQDVIDSTQAYQVYINPINWKVTYALASGGGMAGAVTGVSGLTNRDASTLELGGTLDQTTTINTGGFATNWTGSVAAGDVISATNTAASGTVFGVQGTATASSGGIGVRGTGGNYGVSGISTNGSGVSGVSTNGFGVVGTGLLGASFEIYPASTNTFTQINRFMRGTTGTAANNIGGYNTFDLETTDGNIYTTAQYGAVLTDATTATRTGRFDVWTLNSGTLARNFSVLGSGQIVEPKYGVGTFEAAATYIAGWDGSGNRVEVAVGDLGGGGGGGEIPEDRTLTINGVAQDLSADRTWTIPTFTDPTTTTGDILYRNSSGDLTRLGIGAAGEILTVTSGLPAWATAGSSTTWGGKYSTTNIAGNTFTLPGGANPIYFFSGSSPQTWTLPLISGNGAQTLIIKNAGSAILTVQRQSSDNIITSSAVTSIALDPGEAAMLVAVTSSVTGWQVIFHSDAASGGGGGGAGTPEVNTIDATITTTSDQALPTEAILQYVLVKPASTLAAFKVGTTSDDDKYVTSTPVTAGSDFVVFDVGAHIPASALTVRISGITSSTEIKLIYKTLHE